MDRKMKEREANLPPTLSMKRKEADGEKEKVIEYIFYVPFL